MALHLIGKGSILQTIAGAVNTGGNAVVSGVRDVGDLGSLAAANITSNPVAASNARAAIGSNDSNLSGGNLATNLGGLAEGLGITPAVKAALALPIGAGLDISGNEDNPTAFGNSPLGNLEKFASNNNKTRITDPRQVAGNAILTALNLATAGKGKAAEEAAEGGIRGLLGTGLPSRVASRVGASSTVAGAYGAGQGFGNAVATAQTPAQAASDIIKPTLENAALGGIIGGVTKVPDVVRTTANNLNVKPVYALEPEAPTPSPLPAPDNVPANAEDAIHANNPLAPTPEPQAEPLSEPSPGDLAASQQAADQIDNPTSPIDFNQVEGANTALQQTVKTRADALQAADKQTYGKTSKRSLYVERAEKQLRNSTDEESLHYQALKRYAAIEDELNAYEKANKQSGYNKVRVKNAPAGTPKAIPSYVKEKTNSPEYQAKNESGAFLQRVRDELPGAKDEVKLYDKQRKLAATRGDIKAVTAINKLSAGARLKLRFLEGQERIQGREYSQRARALDEKYPDVALKLKGKRGKVTISDVPVKGEAATVKVRSAETPPTFRTAPVGFEPITSAPYEGPNLNEDAFSPADRQNFESKEGIYADKEAPSRNLKGDTAAFETIKGGGKIDDAVKAYMDATGATEEEATAAVNRVAETGADMGDSEEVLKRNPRYDKVPDFPVKNMKDISEKADSYGNVLSNKVDKLNKLASKLDPSDVERLDQLRGNAIEEVAKGAKNSEQFTKVAEASKDIADYNHEIRRQQGDTTIYREHYGAGIHLSTELPEGTEPPLSGARAELSDEPGFSHERLGGNYDDYTVPRQHDNFIEDVHHDVRSTLAYVRGRSIHQGISDLYGADKVHFGNPTRDLPTQIKGARDVFTTPEIAKEWDRLHPDEENPTVTKLLKPFDAATSVVTQATVMNFGVHTANLLAQGFQAAGKMHGPEGGSAYLKNVAKGADEATEERYLQAAGHSDSYKSAKPGLVSKMTHGLTDFNKNAVAFMDKRFRLAAFKTLIDDGMDDRAAVKQVDDFMGSKQVLGPLQRRFGFFIKFFKTMVGAIYKQGRHPIEQKGTIFNTAVVAGVVWAMDKAWQDYNGNKHAHLHIPGELEIIQEALSSAKDVFEHHYLSATDILTNRVNPIIKEALQQFFDKDSFTGKSLEDSGGRGSHILTTLFPEGAATSKVQSGKQTIGEAALNFGGTYTPHAKGAPAVTKGPLKIINTKHAVSPKTGDPTGVDQQNAYYDTTEKAKNTLPAARHDEFDQLTSSTAKFNDKQTQGHDADLYANPDILAAITKQKQAYAAATHTPLDPLYSPALSTADRAEYLHLQSLPYKGNDYVQQQEANKSWLPTLEAARAQFYVDNPIPPGEVTKSERVLPPTFNAQTEADLNTATGLSGVEKATFIANHADLQTAYAALAKYTNDRRVAEGNAPFKLYPNADSETTAIINNYDALPQGDGPNGGSPERSAWIKANPTAYAKMEDYFSAVSEYELAQSAGQDQFKGATPSQEELKSAYNLGQYDIAVTKNSDGTKTYELNPQQANINNYAAVGGGSSTANGLSYAQDRAIKNAVKYSEKKPYIKIVTQAQSRRRNPKVRIKEAKPKIGKLRIKAKSGI